MTATATKTPDGDRKRHKRLTNAIPGTIQNDHKETILAAAKASYPNEACGFIVTKGKRQRVVECRNTAKEPWRRFRIEPDEREAVEDAGETIAIVWHSHTNESPEPSQDDKAWSESEQLPFLIVAVPSEEWRYYEPNGYEAPLMGRPFVHGVFDCFGLLRDAFRQELKIDLPNFDRPDEWWLDGKSNLIIDNIKAGGFQKVDGKLQKYDAIVMTVGGSKYPNHIGVYWGNGHMIHHLADNLSREIPYLADRGYYAEHTDGIYRHKSFLD
jgi:proteasome lid subunit RPN8/RPN11